MQQHPEDVRVQLYKAETLLADKKYKLAAGQFESILEQHPDNVDRAQQPGAGLPAIAGCARAQVAEQAYKLASDQPVVMDTLGWILVEQGDTARGVPILQKASALAPQARDIRYHLAMGLTSRATRPPRARNWNRWWRATCNSRRRPRRAPCSNNCSNQRARCRLNGGGKLGAPRG